ncbi:antibiotic biosynthesis monooxygenase family protein [Geodermatophilus sp. SYSU D00867]
MSPGTLINCFEVTPERDERFLQPWRQADDLLRSTGGYRTTRLHEALGPQARSRHVHVAELASVETWRSAVAGPEFAALAARMTDLSPTPGFHTVEIARSTAGPEQDR